MTAAQQGDQRAYSILLHDLTPLLRRIVARRWRHPQDVEDIVQEVLISMHVMRHTYDAQRPFMPWLLTICQRRIADAARSFVRRSSNETTVDVMPEVRPEPDDPLLDQTREDQQAAVRRALADLPPGYREAVELTKFEGMSLDQAAAATGKSVSAVKIAVHRAIKSIRRSVERKA